MAEGLDDVRDTAAVFDIHSGAGRLPVRALTIVPVVGPAQRNPVTVRAAIWPFAGARAMS
ncbi:MULTISPECIES: hypothetical protein [unclassified Streptomyces]|uniref:hypothetical protein n=1 Tax=unclassified Streptomyces TaxID=2593676 RepID=UPI0038127061